MPKLKVTQGGWVVVCDGAKALLIENIGDEVFPNFKTREVHEQPDNKTHELGTDAPGRSFSSVGPGRSAVEQTDWHDEQERTFLISIAARLNTAAEKKETGMMIVIAPPRALGVLRQQFAPALRKIITAEIDKDYVKMPVYEIEKQLAG